MKGTTSINEHTEQKEKKTAIQLPVSLRDYFAAQAMQALVNNKDVNKTVKEIKNPDVLPRLVSGMAYEIADAMMKAREK